jgi:outer membrane protein OmpA-like peptidoglycan-associated protein
MNLRALLCAGVLTSVPALAQTTLPSFDLEHLQPDPGSPNSPVVSSGDGLTRGTLRVSLLADYEHDPLVYFKDGQRVGAIIGSRFTAHLGAAYAIFDWFELGLQLPFVLAQGGDDLTTSGFAPVSSTAMGAPVLQTRFTVLREAAGRPIDLAVTLGMGLPLGSGSALARDARSGVTFIPRVGAARTFGGLVRVGAEVGFSLRAKQTLSPFAETISDQVGSSLTLGATASTVGQGLRGEVDLRGQVPLSQTGSAVELLVGGRYPFLNHALEVFALVGPGFGAMPGTPNLRVLAGLAWTPVAPVACLEGQPYALAECPALDRDGDGVANADDQCPEQAGLAALHGCADRDDDGDGVLNLADACPKQPGDAAHHGCKPVDTDGDGVPDELDACPTVAAKGGCPADADHDGIPDDQDACPNEAGVSAQKGCADVDSDGDGVVDGLDKCPGEKGGADGCPEKAQVKVTQDKLELADKVYFELNKADVAQKSFELLSKVADILKAHPELSLVRIEGHTDNAGPRDFNVSLSQKRADAVKKFLVEHGVAPTRLEAKGFGPDRPIASNDDAAGREQNRRVDFYTSK